MDETEKYKQRLEAIAVSPCTNTQVPCMHLFRDESSY